MLDVAEHSLTRDGRPVALTPKLFELLQVLATSGGHLVKKDDLMKAVWPDAVVEEGNLTKGIFLLRQALGDIGEDKVFIETVPRVGYRFLAPVESGREHSGVQLATPPSVRRADPVPETRYAKSGDVHIAYQVVGSAGPDLVLVPGWVSHVEYAWEDPWFSAFLRKLASFSRLILLDRRGTGLSDPVRDLPSLEQRMDDVRAVMDAAGSEQAALFGVSEGGPLCIMLAATYPERTKALMLFGTAACWMRTPDYPIGIPAATLDDLLARIGAMWGSGISAELFAPSVAKDEAFRRSWARFERFAVSPAGIQTVIRMLYEIDVRQLLPIVRVPTLVIHRQGDAALRVEGARYIAERIAGAKYVELPGADHFPFVGDVDAIVDPVREFVTGIGRVRETDGVLATVLLTQIVAPSQRANAKGGRSWRELLARHDEIARRELERLRGREVKTVGDGFCAIFDGPARAIRCACAIRDAVRALGADVKAGLHAGECELLPGDVGGPALRVGAAVLDAAEPGEVLVTSTVKDLVAGSQLRFTDRGMHERSGVGDPLRLFAAES